MEYKFFKEVIKIAERIVLIGGSQEEIKDYFIRRGLNITDYQVEDFMTRSKVQ